MSKRLLVLAAFVASLAAATAQAVDGVIEINHAKVVAAGGYPYRINQPGSYRLTSNLIQPDPATRVVEITASNVTLDLNGFTIQGTNVCALNDGLPPVMICSQHGAPGIHGDVALRRIAIRNGYVTGMAGNCIQVFANNTTIENVAVSHCGTSGTVIFSGVISRVHSSYTGHFGISASDATIGESQASHSAQDGINTSNAVVRYCRAHDNGSFGIRIFSGTVIGNVIYDNQGAGLRAGARGVSYSANALYGNGAGNTEVAPGASLLNGGGNICDGVACP